METRRTAAHRADPDAARKLCDLFLSAFPPTHGQIVAGYYACGSELDPAPLLKTLRTHGLVTALPVVIAAHMPLIFRAYTEGDHLESGFLPKVMEPLPSAPNVEPDVILVPLLGFDTQGFRLGYGGGYYDRTINQLRQYKKLTVIGLGFSCQKMPEVPVGAYDARLDAIVTEQECLCF